MGKRRQRTPDPGEQLFILINRMSGAEVYHTVMVFLQRPVNRMRLKGLPVSNNCHHAFVRLGQSGRFLRVIADLGVVIPADVVHLDARQIELF